MSKFIDLRSDTLTTPSTEMREFMMRAPVGDMYYDEDPTVCALESHVAAMFDFEAAVFMPSGTMSNQIALRLHCPPGSAVLCPLTNHIVKFETGALAALNGLQVVQPDLEETFIVRCKSLPDFFVPQNALHAPFTSLVAVENTHLSSGGRVYPYDKLKELSVACKSLGLPLHCDGARIWHAHYQDPQEFLKYGKLFDSLSVCFSKGLGAPVGSCLLIKKHHVTLAKRYRKMFGGTMRQAGILASGALFALEHNLKTLKDDHDKAKYLAEQLSKNMLKFFPDFEVLTPETNVVFIKNRGEKSENLATVCATLKERFGIVVVPFDRDIIRAVLHRDVTLDDLKQALGNS